MKITFDFNLEAWIKGVEIEADSYDEALEKLTRMSFEDLVRDGYAKDYSIDHIDGVITEKTIKVRAYDIEYDIEEDDYEDLDEYTKLINSLPDSLTVEITLEPSQLEDLLIADEITYETGYEVRDFKFTIIEER
jgi:hypothetical protein